MSKLITILSKPTNIITLKADTGASRNYIKPQDQHILQNKNLSQIDQKLVYLMESV